MSDIQRIYRRSEKIPRRPCPDCKRPVRGRWVEHPGFTADVDPLGGVTWRCFGEECINGKEGF